MLVYLFRHAPAAPVDPARVEAEGAANADVARPLTPRGKRRFRAEVRGLRRMSVAFDQVLYSPWRRAVETADLLLDRLDGRHGATDLLAGPPTEALLELLRGQSVAVIGHQPWMGELLGWLVASERALGERVDWKKGGVACLEGEPRPGGMVLRGFWSPRLLRRLG
jgi:phosphohistidine phosphatase